MVTQVADQVFMYEFLVPSEVLLADGDDWRPLTVSRNSMLISVHKPKAGNKVVPLEGTRGNEGIHLGYSICHVGVTVPENQSQPEWYIPLETLKKCLQWIRVLGRQYWIGVLPNMSRVLARGSIIRENGSYTNFGGYTTRLPVGPFTKQQWEWVGVQLQADRSPLIPEVLLSDALISFSEDDFFQTVIRLGIVCELELNAFIEDLLVVQSEAVQALYDERKPFEWKLKNVPGILGAEKYQDHNGNWAKQLCIVYGLRGAAIHHAKCQINGKEVGFEEVANFLFATFDFLEWTGRQRAKLGLRI
jgi:hypothetical protein